MDMDFNKKFTFRRALLLPFRITPVATLLSVLNNLVSMVIAPINIIITAYFINTAIAVVADGQDSRTIVMPLVAMAAFSVYRYISGTLLNLVNQRAAIKTRLKLRVPFLEKRVRLEYKHAENRETVDLLERVWNGPEWQISGVFSNYCSFVLMVGITVSQLVILIMNAPLAGVAIIVLSVPILYISHKAGSANFEAYRESTADRRYFWNFDWLFRDRNLVAERNMFGYSNHLSEKSEYHYETMRLHELRVNVRWFFRTKMSAILLGLLSAASLFIMAPSVAGGSLSVGLFIALQAALFSSINTIGWGLASSFNNFAHQREYLKDLNNFLELSEVEGAETLPVPFEAFESLEFNNVSFTYPGTEKLILDNLSLTIEKDKHYSFVGVNGAGKTTLVKLITRLYDNYTGEISLNGKELREWSLPEIKGCFCVLFQDFARYDITVAENAAIGKINGSTDEEINHALEKSGFDETAAELADGKDTLLGKTHDKGVDLSGGQWQRLAFARAVISPAPVKILDEPTAALDPVAESKVYAKFESISRGFTTILISHRLASAKLADVIYVLEGGKVVEKGSHDELIAEQGIYAEMYESQQSWYR